MTSTQARAPLTRRGIPLERDLRVLALGSFANRFGAGAVMTTSALYFTRQVGFSAAEVALALAVAAVVGIVVQVPAGHLGDTYGPRRVLTVCMVGAALTSALQSVAVGLLEDHLRNCVADAARAGSDIAEEKVREASQAIARLVR